MRHYLEAQEKLIAQQDGMSTEKQHAVRAEVVRLCRSQGITVEQLARIVGVVCTARRTVRDTAQHTPSLYSSPLRCFWCGRFVPLATPATPEAA